MTKTKLPLDPDELNAERASWALAAAQAFASKTRQNIDNDGLEEIIGDLLIDLAHLADRSNFALLPLIKDIPRVYLEETEGTGRQFDGLPELALNT